jgi:hypothetical protein
VLESAAKKLGSLLFHGLCMESLNLNEHSCSSWSYFSAFEVHKHDYGSTNEGAGLFQLGEDCRLQTA